MKILHICLASFYIDNYSYQENLLPKFHKKLGFEVSIIASLITFDENGEFSLLNNTKTYLNENDISVTRLNYRNGYINKVLRNYKGLYQKISENDPDIIFIHGCQFMDIQKIVKYVINNPNVKVYVDNHADFSNSARNYISKNILHKIIWRKCAKLIEPFTETFFGVLPARVDFLKEMYCIPPKKIKLLIMGADDELVNQALTSEVRDSIRSKYNIHPSDFLIVSGGKIDNAKKQTLTLMKAIKEIERNNVKLIVFGSITEDLKKELFQLTDDSKVQYVGWIDSSESYKYFAAADLVIFPGRHSVFWEQVVALQIPMIVKHWEGTTHIDIGGNCLFLQEDSLDEVKRKILYLLDNKEKYNHMKKIAMSPLSQEFLYSKIAEKSITDF